jgi:hypothetical protein
VGLHGDLLLPKSPNLGDEAALGYIRQQLGRCEQNHPACSLERLYHPTRLLDVDIPQHPDMIRLLA